MKKMGLLISVFLVFTESFGISYEVTHSPEILKLRDFFLTDHFDTGNSLHPFFAHVKKALHIKKRRGFAEAGNVPDDQGNSVLEHTLHLRRAILAYGRHFKINHEKAEIMGLIHDFPEYIVEDYTLLSSITPIQKFNEEKAAFVDLIEKVGPEYKILLEYWLEFEECLTQEAKLDFHLDKMDGAITAEHFGTMGYTGMEDFYFNSEKKITDLTLKKIGRILLKKEFPKINIRDQYFILLRVNGDEEAFREEILNPF
jgi:5'-deoxynucleotidase YfbR-like HD superfamily hydrolase